jgi:hypothetical protein
MAADTERVIEGLTDGRAVPWFGTIAELQTMLNRLGIDPADITAHGTLIPVKLTADVHG